MVCGKVKIDFRFVLISDLFSPIALEKKGKKKRKEIRRIQHRLAAKEKKKYI